MRKRIVVHRSDRTAGARAVARTQAHQRHRHACRRAVVRDAGVAIACNRVIASKAFELVEVAAGAACTRNCQSSCSAFRLPLPGESSCVKDVSEVCSRNPLDRPQRVRPGVCPPTTVPAARLTVIGASSLRMIAPIEADKAVDEIVAPTTVKIFRSRRVVAAQQRVSEVRAPDELHPGESIVPDRRVALRRSYRPISTVTRRSHANTKPVCCHCR